MTVSMAEEKLIDILDELKPLFCEHYLEIARHQEIIKLNPDYNKYFEMERNGSLLLTVARADGKVIGYCFTFISPHLHYQDCLMALNDIILIKKEFRKGFTAMKLIKFTEKCLEKRGVLKSHITLKIAHDFGKLLERMGYVAIERVYEKMFLNNKGGG